MSEQLESIQQDNREMIFLIMASVAACFVVLVVSAVVIYKWMKKTDQPIQQNQHNQK